MATMIQSTTRLQNRTVADLIDSLGGVPADRVLLDPPPGTATEKDVLRMAESADRRLCELIDGTLVEKTVGFIESRVAAILIRLMDQFVTDRSLGIVASDEGMIRLLMSQVRIPDLAYYSTERLPEGKTPLEPIPSLVPDLAVEVISPGNTSSEMQRKRQEYFEAGVRMVWEVNPRERHASIWTGNDQCVSLTASNSLDGGDVLPGFCISLAELFASIDPPAKK